MKIPLAKRPLLALAALLALPGMAAAQAGFTAITTIQNAYLHTGTPSPTCSQVDQEYLALSASNPLEPELARFVSTLFETQASYDSGPPTFTETPTYSSRNPSSSSDSKGFVTDLYGSFLQRPPDNDGTLTYQASRVDSDGRANVLQGFSQCQEFMNLAASLDTTVRCTCSTPPAGLCDGAPCNVTQNPYWPSQAGNSWTFRNAATFSPVVVTLQPSPPTFGCAPNPIPVTFYKIDPTNYWAPNNYVNLHWFMGVKPNQDVIFFGHYWTDLADLKSSGTNYYSTAPVCNADTYPGYVLLRAGGAAAAPVTIPMVYFQSATTNDTTCHTPQSPDGYADWKVTWTDAYVSTPAYTGTALLADIVEDFSEFHEQWYFVSGLGPVRIIDTHGITLELVDYRLGTGEAVSPNIHFRDLLVAQAGTTSGLNFDQWNYYSAQATHQAFPPPEDVCLDPANRGNLLTVDQYLSLLENRSTPCSSVQWPELGQVLAAAQSDYAYSDGLNWDQWMYFYLQAGGSSVSTQDACMHSVYYKDEDTTRSFSTEYPNRYVIYTARQWFGLLKYAQGGGSCQ